MNWGLKSPLKSSQIERALFRRTSWHTNNIKCLILLYVMLSPSERTMPLCSFALYSVPPFPWVLPWASPALSPFSLRAGTLENTSWIFSGHLSPSLQFLFLSAFRKHHSLKIKNSSIQIQLLLIAFFPLLSLHISTAFFSVCSIFSCQILLFHIFPAAKASVFVLRRENKDPYSISVYHWTTKSWRSAVFQPFLNKEYLHLSQNCNLRVAQE